jgi:nitrite reductase/ring-hydroxylating ferredoxin subunit
VRQPGDRLCDSSVLVDGGTGFRFELEIDGRREPAFAIRHDGVARAYLNRCAHKLVELDWLEGQFFDESRHHLICATHGALYDPATGACLQGPCKGGRLVSLIVDERDGGVWLAESGRIMLK